LPRFGPGFIQIFKTLYRNIPTRIVINGFASESIRIERGAKQSDALSCAIFIIWIDPLLRSLNKNKRVKEIKLRRKKLQMMKKSTLKVQLMQMISLSSVKKHRLHTASFL
jgi:hypothetical protein